MAVIARATGQPGSAQGVSSASEFQFADGAGNQANVKINGRSIVNKQFKVRAGGRAFAATATNLTVNLDFGTSTTIGSNTTIATSGAIALDTDGTTGSFIIEAILKLSPLSATVAKLQGWYYAYVNDGTLANSGALTKITEVASVDSTGEIGFTVTGTMSASNAGNGAYLDYLEIVAL